MRNKKYSSPNIEIIHNEPFYLLFTSIEGKKYDESETEVIGNGGDSNTDGQDAKAFNGGVKDWDTLSKTWED